MADQEPSSTPAPETQDAPSMIERTVRGSCHCKFITYEVTIPLPMRPRLPIASRCNCTVCLKAGFTSLSIPNPSRNFKLLSPAPATRGTSSTSTPDGFPPSTFSSLADYQPNSPDIHRHFCDKCGVTVLGRGFYEFGGQKVDFFSVNAATIDQPQEGVDLSLFKMEYWDGRRDGWEKGKKESPWEGGLV